MDLTADGTLSIAISRSRAKSERTTKQTLHILDFIHRFRHVTSRHIQLALGHSSITTSNNRLALLCAKGLIARQYDKADRAHNQPASYYLTPEGLKLLKARKPERRYRLVRSVKTDAVIGEKARARFHTLADVYAHFKRHYDGCFRFLGTFDLTHFQGMPDETPDGFIYLKLPGRKAEYYFVEIYGWGRSTQQQQRRINGYFEYADYETWQSYFDDQAPNLLLVVSGVGSKRRASAAIKRGFDASFADRFQVLIAKSYELDGESRRIWLRLRDQTPPASRHSPGDQ
jgi:hypothetical protein